MENIGVSIIICCFNSAKRLKPTLEHIAKQKVDDAVNWELLIIDNASVDNTSLIAKEILDNINFKCEYTILLESQKGLMFARKRAIAESKYKYLLFCDDDNWLNENYLQNAFEILESDHKIGALGGWGEPIFEINPPKWFLDLGINYATDKQASQTGEVPKNLSYVYGAGAVYRKEIFTLLDQYKVNFYLTGRKGKLLLSSEDVEIGYWISLLGYKIWFSENLLFKHHIEKNRLDWNYIIKHAYGHGISRAFLRPYANILFNIKYNFLKDLLQLLKDVYSIVKYRGNDITIKKCKINFYQRIGEIYAYMNFYKKIKNQERELQLKLKIISNAKWIK